MISILMVLTRRFRPGCSLPGPKILTTKYDAAIDGLMTTNRARPLMRTLPAGRREKTTNDSMEGSLAAR